MPVNLILPFKMKTKKKILKVRTYDYFKQVEVLL